MSDVVFVLDPLDRLDPSLDTSIGFMHAVQEFAVFGEVFLQLQSGRHFERGGVG